jgi:hypothetical protein
LVKWIALLLQSLSEEKRIASIAAWGDAVAAGRGIPDRVAGRWTALLHVLIISEKID